jgi:hypothetical protein
MLQCLELVRNVPQVIPEWFLYLRVLTHKDISSFRTTCGSVSSWLKMSSKSFQSDSFTFVYSLRRIFHHLGLHVTVYRVGQKCPPSQSRVIPLPLCTHSQGYFIIEDYMMKCLELVRNVPQVIPEWFLYLCVLTHKDISSFRTTCSSV